MNTVYNLSSKNETSKLNTGIPNYNFFIAFVAPYFLANQAVI